MPSRQPKAVRHELTRRVGILQVGEDHDQRPAPDAEGEVRERVAEVGLDVSGLERVQRLGDDVQLGGAAVGLDE